MNVPVRMAQPLQVLVESTGRAQISARLEVFLERPSRRSSPTKCHCAVKDSQHSAVARASAKPLISLRFAKLLSGTSTLSASLRSLARDSASYG